MVTLTAPLTSTVLPQLNTYRLTNFLTDLTISCVPEVGHQEEFHCHKLVLSSVSDFVAGLIKENPCSHPIIILHTPPTVFEHLLTFVYTGSVTVTTDLLPDFLCLCNQLQISNNYDISNNTQDLSNKSLLSQALEKPIKDLHPETPSGPIKSQRSESESAISRSNSPHVPTGSPDLLDQPSPFPIPLLPLFDKPLTNLLFSKPHHQNPHPPPPSSSSSSSRIRATDPRPCPKCGKIYRSAHTLRTHLEDKHTSCPGYRCVLCGTVAKSRNSLHSHMSRQHRGISTKELPVVPMPSPFDPILASKLLAKVGREGVNFCDTEKTTSSTSSNSDTESTSASTSNNNNQLPQATSSTGSVILDTYLQFIAENHMFGERIAAMEGVIGGSHPQTGFKKFKFSRHNNSHSTQQQPSQNCIYDSD